MCGFQTQLTTDVLVLRSPFSIPLGSVLLCSLCRKQQTGASTVWFQPLNPAVAPRPGVCWLGKQWYNGNGLTHCQTESEMRRVQAAVKLHGTDLSIVAQRQEADIRVTQELALTRSRSHHRLVSLSAALVSL